MKVSFNYQYLADAGSVEILVVWNNKIPKEKNYLAVEDELKEMLNWYSTQYLIQKSPQERGFSINQKPLTIKPYPMKIQF